MTHVFIEVHSPTVPSRRHRLPAAPSIVGTGAGVALELPCLENYPPVRLHCARRPDGMRVRIESPRSVLLRLRGAEHSDIVIPWGDDVFLGSLRLCFFREGTPEHRWVSALSLIVSAASLTAGIVCALRWSTQPLIEAGHALPPLAVRSIPCPAGDPGTQATSGEEAERTAAAKQERFPFDPREGTLVLDYLVLARACYAAAADPLKTTELGQAYDSWKVELELQARTLLLTLEESIAEKRFAEAKRLGARLRALLHQHAGHPFMGWLRELDRWLATQLAS